MQAVAVPERPVRAPGMASLYVHNQLHFGVNVTADLEGAGGRKAFGKILARGLLIGVEQTGGINLMNEFVIIGEGQRFALVDRHFAGVEGPAALNDGMRAVRGPGGGTAR